MDQDRISEAERRRIYFRKVGLENVDWHGSCQSKHFLAEATILHGSRMFAHGDNDSCLEEVLAKGSIKSMLRG
jgi:hypothetical protein